LSIMHPRTKLVLSVFEALAAEGRNPLRPGDLTTRLRERNQPLSYWEVRGELAQLETAGLIELDAATGAWQLATDAARKAG